MAVTAYFTNLQKSNFAQHLVYRVILARFAKVIWEKYTVLRREKYYKMCARFIAN